VVKTVENGTTWALTEKTQVDALTVESEAVLEAPDGYTLTMTVNGVETAIQEGTYKGDIVLTPAKKISKALYSEKGGNASDPEYRTGLFVNAGQVIEESSVTSALVGGTYDNTSASGMSITSDNELFEGIIINDSKYTVSDVTMDAKGPGFSDFLGLGAGIAVTGKSQVTIDRFTFNGSGPLRHGIFVGVDSPENLTVTVNDSFIKTDGSEGEVLSGSIMTNVPWVLGLETYGHVRAQMIEGFADVTYKNSTLLADGWGVLSTDGVGTPKNYGDMAVTLTAENCIVDITGTSGYGSYAIGACRNIFSNTVMGNTQHSTDKYGLTYALVVANEYAGGDFVNGTNVTARYGVMYHKTQTGLTTVDDSTFTTNGASFLIKHCYPIINVSNSTLTSDAGVIVQLMTSDDPGLMGSSFKETMDPASVAKDKSHDIYHVNKIDTKIFNTAMKDVVTDAQVNFSKMEIKGDFYNSVSGETDQDLQFGGQNLVLSFDEVDLTGVISSTTALHKNYSYYFAKETDPDGNPIVVDAGGRRIEGTWEEWKGMFAASGGEMPSGMSSPADAVSGGPGGEGMPGGMEGEMPEGGMMGGMPGGGSSKIFSPTTDADGNFVTVGDKKYDLYEGVIVEKNATYLGDMVNTITPAVNNGVIVTLKNGTVWTVTGTSYLTGLTLENAVIKAPEGDKIEMTVNGVKTPITAGSYEGDIIITIAD
jgi:hypothetical protein